MAANPLTYTEVGWFCRLRRADMKPWQVDLIMELDDTVREVWAEADGKSPRKAPDEDETETQIPVSNVKGLKALFGGIKVAKAVQFGKKDG